jgi:hypothetical protein
MKIIATKRYKELLADSNENLAREITIINLQKELKEKDEYIKKLKAELHRKAQPRQKQAE